MNESTLLRLRRCLSCDAVDHHSHVGEQTHIVAPCPVARRKPPKIGVRNARLARRVLTDQYLEGHSRAMSRRAFTSAAWRARFPNISSVVGGRALYRRAA